MPICMLQENVTLNSLSVASNSKIFVLPGATLTLSLNGFSLGQNGSMISVGEGAKLILNNGQLQASILVFTMQAP